MTIATLDVTKLPRDFKYGDGNLSGLAGLLLRPAVDQWARDGLVRPNASFGMAFANPTLAYRHYQQVWDKPELLVGFVYGWGPERNRYIANAVRKLRPAARTGKDTLALRHAVETDPSRPSPFENEVASAEDDGSFAWGDFPWGGAAFASFRDRSYLTAVSCLDQIEDHWAALMLGGFLAAEIDKQDRTT